MKTNIRILLVLLLAGQILFSGCSESFKNKMVAGMAVGAVFGSTSVTVGVSSRASTDKGSRSLTTITCDGVKWSDYDENKLQMMGCLAAYDFMKKLEPADVKSDEYIGIDLKDNMDGTKELEYKVADLLALEQPIKTAESFYKSFSKGDGNGILALSDTSYINQPALLQILELNRQVDSAFAGGQRKVELSGLNSKPDMVNGENAHQVNLTEMHNGLKVSYLIYIDKQSKKIIGVSYDSKQSK